MFGSRNHSFGRANGESGNEMPQKGPNFLHECSASSIHYIGINVCGVYPFHEGRIWCTSRRTGKGRGHSPFGLAYACAIHQ